MNVRLITPARLGDRAGNSVTAVRWASILSELGHETVIAHDYRGESTEVLIALNAYRSARAIEAFRHRHRDRPLVVALTGTDLYRFARSHPDVTLRSIELADRLLVLNDLAYKAVPETAREKLFLIYESARPLPGERRPLVRHFDVCVIGHLRDEKDPLRTALAVRDLPEGSRIRVRHYGAAHTEQWARMAREEMARNRRYHWLGEVAHWRVRRALGRCRLMALTSTMEGGPNTVSEAVVAGVPVISSDVAGAMGVLGEDYPGYFPVGDTEALRRRLLRAETDPVFMEQLERYVARLAPRFGREQEKARWAELLATIGSEGDGSENR
jgi:putative glycosyltransferase (TIGR04348 family)